MVSLAPKIKILSTLAKKSWKIEIEPFQSGAISQKNYSSSEIFWPGLLKKHLYSERDQDATYNKQKDERETG